MRINRLVITAVGLVGSVAVAQPADTAPAPQDPTQPPLVQSLAGTYSPAAFGGNLRLSLSCADYFATADQGLELAVDGARVTTVGVNGVNATVGYTKHGNPIEGWVATDAGYVVGTPGRHHVAITAPGCSPYEADIEIPTLGPRFVEGRLAISDPGLLGTAAAPNGFTHVFGAYSTWRSGETGTATFVGTDPARYALQGAQFTGFYYSAGLERRHLVIASDTEWGAGTIAGNVSGQPTSIDALHFGARLRAGYRIPLHDLAFAFGSGIGGDMYILNQFTPTPSSISKPGPIEGDFTVPLWASVTYKPSCNWGVQVTALYDVQPTDLGASAPTVQGGLIYQPNDACSQPAGVTVR